jgi:hypothetical protein
LPPPLNFLYGESNSSLALNEASNILFTDSTSQQVHDSEAPRNNIIASPGASEFFSLVNDVDIPLQLSDLFLSDDEEEE